jgi:EAL domain-containing protein (putative c-di-GMP-specific phosphodiesterase class I)
LSRCPGAAQQAHSCPIRPLAEHVRLNFQPQLCCDTGQLAALRVVIHRPSAPDGGRLELADLQSRLDGGTLAGITRAALRQALAACAAGTGWASGCPFMSVQIPDRELAEPIIADAIIWELDRLDLRPSGWSLRSANPSAAMVAACRSRPTLQRLAGHGCRIALGNFGSGSAGLADLRRFGVGRVRIGREFIAECDRREDQQHMILAVVALAEHLRLVTLADGVDTADEYAFRWADRLQCGAGQGGGAAAGCGRNRCLPAGI